eukprot:CAMPEP_0198315698 /NCGR_PEP_ID=MMETSP1450-20131203/5876_1 /TAXON_ID=753684 ORGANISM="Madagascaria erythrocladiodes, Strain CCMP3234" /NCGR_SAMPLE_ID=MMETSP1450 /ASSEMBLY_ACC=CAM_ASM_001115 /LENGTH=285 /DNA_ID=CAMNT_0044018823 /DNA_START=85 /DNA_END=942 /DNA_ORIENTATION=+
MASCLPTPAVLHSMKKAGTAVRKSKLATPAEFSVLKTQLTSLAEFLQTNVNNISELQKKWKELNYAINKMTDNFATLYPDTDSVKPAARKAVVGAKKSLDNSSSIESKNGSVGQLLAEVKAYLVEITSLSAVYKKVEDHKVEFEMYRNKLESLNEGKKKDYEKIERNEGKLEAARLNYESALEQGVARMQDVYSNREPVLHSSIVAFWLAQGGHLEQMQKDYVDSIDYAKCHEGALLELDIKKLIHNRKTATPGSSMTVTPVSPPSEISAASTAPSAPPAPLPTA